MKPTARIAAIASPSVIQFAKRLQNKRIGMNPIRTLAANGTAKSFFHRLGFESAGNAFGPEVTIAMCCKEGLRIGITGDKAKINSAIGLVEFTVFGNNFSNYPEFNSFAVWLAWRIPQAHPKERLTAADGWDLEFYQFAVDDSPLSL
jgi:hypothetical protein